MRGSTIIKSSGASPKGHFEECKISGTPKPGTCMELVPATEPTNGNFSYRAASGLDGGKRGVVILLEDKLQGKLHSDAYVNATQGFLYWPVAGEEFNMLVRDQPGTGTLGAENIGDLLEIDGATGKLQAVGTTGLTGAHASAPFMLLEHRGVDVTGDAWVWVKYLGNNA